MNGPAGAPLAARLLDRCQWPPGAGPLAAAVSGGADSLALLILAVTTGRPVTAIHVDHGLRPGSDREASVVQDAALRLGAAFEARVVRLEPGPNMEARARQARYEVLPAGVLTGHTADDQAETVLLNVLRGAGLDGLAGIRAEGRAVRPLLAVRRWETAALCADVGLHPIDDPSNSDPRYRRNQVRHRLLPLLAEIGERDPVAVLARQAHLLAEDAALLNEMAAAVDPTDVRALQEAPVALARRAVRRWLSGGSDTEHHPPSAAEVERVLAVAGGQAVACQVAGGRRVNRSGGRLTVS